MSTLEKRISYREILAIAVPMVISQGSETVMMLADRFFLSHVSMEYLAAAMSGGLTNFVLQSFFIGLIAYTNALVAQYYGAGKLPRALRSVTQGIAIAFFAYPITLALIPLGRMSFVWAGHTPAQVSAEHSYFSILMFGALLSYLRATFAAYFIGLGKTKIVLWANIAGMIFNIPLNYLLIFGKMGFPAMGISGAALGTLGGALLTVVLLWLFYLKDEDYRKYRSDESWKLDGLIFKTLIRYGAPAGVESFLNVLAFNIALQLFHSYSVGVAAAVTITFNYDMVAFIPMLGMGFATTSIVGRFMGSGRPDLAEDAGYKAWRLSLVYGLAIVVLFVGFAGPMVNVFASQFGPDDGQYLKLSRNMLRLASLYIFADMSQVVFASALRGAGDTRWVMTLSVILHWIYATAAIVCIRVLRIPPLSMWLIFIATVIALGLGMAIRYTRNKWKSITLISDS